MDKDNVIITVNADTREARANPEIIAIRGEHMQGQFIVEFSDAFVEGKSARLDISICKTKKRGYIELTKQSSDGTNTYVGNIASSVTSVAGKIQMQLVIIQEDTENSGNPPVFKSSIFEAVVGESINATEKLE